MVFPSYKTSKQLSMYSLLQSHWSLIQQWKKEYEEAVCTTIIAISITCKVSFLRVRQKQVSLMESSTYVYLPKITFGNIDFKIVAFESLTFWWKQPMIFGPDENHLTIQPLFIVLSAVTPFVCERIGRVTPPLFADMWHSWVIIFHPHKRATGIRSRIRLTAKVLDNSFTGTVSGRGHVERTSLLFTTEESQLSKGHIRPEFFHGASVENNVSFIVEANFIVGPLEGGFNR